MTTKYLVTFYNFDKNNIKKIEAFNTYDSDFYLLGAVSEMAKEYLNEHNFDGYIITETVVMELY